MIETETKTKTETKPDLDNRLQRANKAELRDMIKMYRFIALSQGITPELLDSLEADCVQTSRIG